MSFCIIHMYVFMFIYRMYVCWLFQHCRSMVERRLSLRNKTRASICGELLPGLRFFSKRPFLASKLASNFRPSKSGQAYLIMPFTRDARWC
jgi:hypothetical protein